MQPLIIYFNEKSMHGSLTKHEWQTELQKLCGLIDNFFKLRNNVEFSFIDEHWKAILCESTLRDQLFKTYKQHYKASYQLFLKKISVNLTNKLPLLSEVHWNNQIAHGITLAESKKSWVLSIHKSHKDWSKEIINGQRHELDDSGNLPAPTPCEIRNLADDTHIEYWKSYIYDWGLIVAESCILDTLNGHSIVMYPGPKEHNPPHVHVLNKGSSSTLAKYRIQDCMLEDGKPTLNAEIKKWITDHRSQLLSSWERCQRGGHPYKLEKVQ